MRKLLIIIVVVIIVIVSSSTTVIGGRLDDDGNGIQLADHDDVCNGESNALLDATGNQDHRSNVDLALHVHIRTQLDDLPIQRDDLIDLDLTHCSAEAQADQVVIATLYFLRQQGAVGQNHAFHMDQIAHHDLAFENGIVVDLVCLWGIVNLG